MKYTIKIMRGRDVVFEGELLAGRREGRYSSEQTLDDDELDQCALEIEKVINRETELRCHIEQS